MKNRHFYILLVLILGASIFGYSGCARSPSPKFYLLNPVENIAPGAGRMAEDGCLSIGIGIIGIPEYLDRPQIVTRGTPDEISLAELHRWGEPLQDNLRRALAKNLSNLLCTKTIVMLPVRGKVPIDYRVEMEVLRLDGSLGGNVSLEAWWMIFSGEGNGILLTKKSAFTEAVGGQNYKSLVAAQSRALGRLSGEIAEAIKTLAGKSQRVN